MNPISLKEQVRKLEEEKAARHRHIEYNFETIATDLDLRAKQAGQTPGKFRQGIEAIWKRKIGNDETTQSNPDPAASANDTSEDGDKYYWPEGISPHNPIGQHIRANRKQLNLLKLKSDGQRFD